MTVGVFRGLLLVMLIGGCAPRAQALMVGQAPDSPAARVNPIGDLIWFTDRAAAGEG